MNHQEFVNCCARPCCVIAVERRADGSCGDISITCSNQRYKDIMGPAYYDGMPYHELVPKDLKFEDFCFRAAFLDQQLHAYVETKGLGTWTDQMLIPMKRESEDVGYCQFVFEFTAGADSERMVDVSHSTAELVIKTGLMLLASDNFSKSVENVLNDILEFSGALNCRILLINHDRAEAVTFCDVLDETRNFKWKPFEVEIPYETVKTWEPMIGSSNAVIVKDEREMDDLERRNPVWVREMRSYGVTSLILIPLRRGETIVGYLYITNFDVEKTVETKELIELMSFILGSEIANYQLLKRLEELSNVDGLTGLYNRHAMQRRMVQVSEGLSEGQPFGIINIDLNGLKPVNDNEGHEAGDRLLIQAAEILKKVFYDEDLFRTGGDEFIVISSDITRETFERKIERLHSDVDKNANVSFAIGSFWSDGSVDVHSAFVQADERMYADKRDYYDRHPEKRRTAAN